MVRNYDAGLVTLNLVLLFCIAFLPYPTAGLSDQAPGDTTVATMFYAACISATGLASTALVAYAFGSSRRLVDPTPRSVAPALSRFRGAVTPIVFLAAIRVAGLVGYQIAWGLWALPFLLQPLGRRTFEGARRRSSAPSVAVSRRRADP